MAPFTGVTSPKMSSANPLVTSATTAAHPAHPAAMANGFPGPSSRLDGASTGGYPGHTHTHDTRPGPVPPPGPSKNRKNRKPMDSNEASKLVAARISQLELDAAGEKDQEAEIGASLPSFSLRLSS